MKILVNKTLPKKTFTLKFLPGNFIKHLFFLLLTAFFLLPAFAQNNILVKGRILNENNQPVGNASVVVKGTANGTTSDESGNFQISAPSNGTLVISSVGYGEKEISINGRQAINISMGIASADLEQVIVVGYGTQKKRDVTGAVVSVSGNTLREVAAPNVIAQLKGRTAGVDIVSNSSTPGGGGQIRIRGNRSIASDRGTLDALDQPLLVVDGIPYGGSINDINPEDVASLEILKDASATAIYGSRGSGGVILLSTKRGRTGKAVFSLDSYYGISNVLDKLNVFNGAEYAQFKLDAAQGVPPPNTGTTAYGLTNAEQAALAAGISTDWQDLIYQQGFTTNHQIGLSGGSEGTQFSLGGGYFNETGIIPNQKFERYTLRATIDHRVNKRFRLGLNTLNSLSYTNTPGGGGVPGGLIRLTPLAAPYNADGTVNLLPWIGSTDATFVSPLTLITKSDAILARTRRLRTFNSLYGEVELFEGLKYRLNLGLDFRQNAGGSYNGPLTYTNTATSFSQANANVNDAEAYTYTVENLFIV